MVNDWFIFKNPSRKAVESLVGIPGIKFNFAGKEVASIAWHISHTKLMPVEALGSGPDSFGSFQTDARLFAAHMRNVTPRDYQQDDLPFVLSRRASILGYEMRLGKTALATIAHNPADGPIVIAAPLIARDVWATWIERVHGFAPFLCTTRDAIAMPGFAAYFVNYDILDSWAGMLATLRPSTLILDECHLLQARRSKRISSAAIIASVSKRIIGLSGTPMWSNPRSMWPILNLLAPGAWGTEFEFSQRYTNATPGAYGWKYDGINNNDELKARLSDVVVRRTWESVLGQLPPTTNVVEPVEMSNEQRVALETIAQKQMLANASIGQQSTVAGYHASLRKLFGSVKVPRAVELATQAMKDGHKVVIWHWHNDVGSEIVKQLVVDINDDNRPDYRIRAEDSQGVRQMRIGIFNARTSPCVFIAPLGVAGVGIDLSSADLNIFCELDWIPATNNQAAMRIFKPNRPHSNVFLYADTPIERRLIEVLGCNEACQTSAGLGYTEIARHILDGV